MKNTALFVFMIMGTVGRHFHPQSDLHHRPNPVSDTVIDRAIKVLEKRDVEYAYPHWSKDATRILFQSNETGLWQIYVMNADGSKLKQLTTDPSNNNFLDWSPDNTKICFVSDRTGNEEVFLMDASGEHQEQLTFNTARDIHPYWSPDGSTIFFSSTRDDPNAFELYQMDMHGRNVKRITHDPDDETCARLSPTGNNLVFLRNNEEGLDDIFMLNLTDSVETRMTTTKSTDGWPCWFPNGKAFVFSTKENDRYKLFIYNLASGSMKKISEPPPPSWDGRANISRDGKKIVFNRQIEGVKNTIGIYILNLE